MPRTPTAAKPVPPVTVRDRIEIRRLIVGYYAKFSPRPTDETDDNWRKVGGLLLRVLNPKRADWWKAFEEELSVVGRPDLSLDPFLAHPQLLDEFVGLKPGPLAQPKGEAEPAGECVPVLKHHGGDMPTDAGRAEGFRLR